MNIPASMASEVPMTPKKEVLKWLKEGKEQGATHTIVVCDDFDCQEFPVHIMPNEDVRQMESDLEKMMEQGTTRRVDAVYSHAIDHETQLSESEQRPFHTVYRSAL